MRPTVFTLGRMRHLDLLALYWRLSGRSGPGNKAGEEFIARLSKERLVDVVMRRMRDAAAR